jgi:putative ABC transport system permease protein
MIPVRYNIRSLLVRRTASVMTALGVALVVMILFILLGFIAGLQRTVLQAGDTGNWVVLSRGVDNEPGSYITREQYEIIRARPEIVMSPSGQALISPEMVTGFDASPANGPSNSGETLLRGVYPIAYEVHRGMRLVAGRWPAQGRAEVVVGRKLVARFPNLAPPVQLHFGRRIWTVVGIFADRDSARESEMWTDLDVLQQDIRYRNGFASLHVDLKPGTEDDFRRTLGKDVRLRVDAVSEAEFYSAMSQFAAQLRAMGLVVAAILAIGATFGGMNTMYAAVARRGREVGVLRALGFSRANVLASFVIESVMLGLAGGILGELLGVAVAQATGLSSRLMKVGMFIFSFRAAPSAFAAGLAAAAVIGAVGGFWPALRAARLTVVDSLREA